jgi:hypothetical protein
VADALQNFIDGKWVDARKHGVEDFLESKSVYLNLG